MSGRRGSPPPARGNAARPALHRGRTLDRSEAELHASVRRRVPRDHARRLAADGASTTSRCRGTTPSPVRHAAGCGSTASSRLEWEITWGGIVDATAPFDVAPWRGGFMRWADETLPEDAAERAITLRRRVRHRYGSRHGSRRDRGGERSPEIDGGVCHTMQPGVVEVALPPRGLDPRFRSHPGPARRQRRHVVNAAIPTIGAARARLARLPRKPRFEKSNTPPSDATIR